VGRRIAIPLTLTLMALTLASVATAVPAGAARPATGGRIAFEARGDQNANIATMLPDGSDELQLTHFATRLAQRPAWSPDGTTLVFEVHNANFTKHDLDIVGADGTGLHRLFADIWYVALFPSFTRDGLSVLFTRCRADFTQCSIWSIGTNGKGLAQITPFSDEHLDFSPVFSPDGSRLAIQGLYRDGVDDAIYLMDADGTMTQLTSSRLGAWAPAWSPDGSSIAFGSHFLDPKNTHVWVIRTDGSGLRRLTGGVSHDSQPSFSPDGTRIAFVRAPKDWSAQGIFVMNADGSGITQIRDNAGSPAWGPAA
jgi:Tol biopolymer transport system component